MVFEVEVSYQQITVLKIICLHSYCLVLEACLSSAVAQMASQVKQYRCPGKTSTKNRPFLHETNTGCHTVVPHCDSPSILPQDPLEFQARELRKYFAMGDHVRVVAGRHEGETGLLVRVEPNLAVVLTDLASHEVCGSVTSCCGRDQSIVVMPRQKKTSH